MDKKFLIPKPKTTIGSKKKEDMFKDGKVVGVDETRKESSLIEMRDEEEGYMRMMIGFR